MIKIISRKSDLAIIQAKLVGEAIANFQRSQFFVKILKI